MKRIRMNEIVVGVGTSSLFLLPSLSRRQQNFFHLPSSFFPHNDCEELVKILVTRCKTLNTAEDKEETKK